MWNARRIFKDLTDPNRRREILVSFWKHAEPTSKLLASAHLAKALHFREETLKKMPAEKKADLLASRVGAPEFDQFLEAGLLQYPSTLRQPTSILRDIQPVRACVAPTGRPPASWVS